jgi:hypothetical protein
MWASLVLLAVCMMLFATLFRISCLQVGTALNRLTLERIVRTGTILAGLCAATVWQDSIPDSGTPPVVALAALGAFTYAIGEIVRAVLRLRFSDRALGRRPWSVRVAVRSDETQLWVQEMQVLAS